MIWATMPKASVEKNRDLLSPKDDVRFSQKRFNVHLET